MRIKNTLSLALAGSALIVLNGCAGPDSQRDPSDTVEARSALVTSPPMPATIESVTNNLIVFSLSSPGYPLYLDTLLTSKSEPTGGLLGNVNPGGATVDEPTSHQLRIGNNKFQSTLSFTNANETPYQILLTYDPITYVVSGFDIGL